MGRIAIAVAAAISGLAIGFLGWRLMDERVAPPIIIDDPRADATVVVAVQGAVATPGIYHLAGSSRVQDALDAAGGVTSDGDVASLNPARRLRDEDLIVVPALPVSGRTDGSASVVASPESNVGTSTDRAGGSDAAASPERIDLNMASAADLDRLPGIGPTLAQRIVDFRSAHGPFHTVDALVDVQGISARMVEELRPLVTVSS